MNMKILHPNENARRWAGFATDLLRAIMVLVAANGHTVGADDTGPAPGCDFNAVPRMSIEHCK
jgi:hypothetical protein